MNGNVLEGASMEGESMEGDNMDGHSMEEDNMDGDGIHKDRLTMNMTQACIITWRQNDVGYFKQRLILSIVMLIHTSSIHG